MTPKLVYEEIRERAQTGQPLSMGSEHHDVVWRNPRRQQSTVRAPDDYEFRWKSFEEWRDGSWQARVLATEEEAREEEEVRRRG